MVRVKRGVTSHRRHRKLRLFTKGYRSQRSRGIKKAKEALMKAGMHAYRHRRRKKRDFRRLWIVRLNAALKARGVHYNRFIRSMEDAKVVLNRKVLSELAIHEPEAFDAVVNTVMSVDPERSRRVKVVMGGKESKEGQVGQVGKESTEGQKEPMEAA